MVNWNEPKFGDKEKVLVWDVLKRGYVSEGPMTKKLELRLAEYLGVKHIIMTTSCTAALYLAIEADKKIIGYTKGYVIMPDVTFVATKNAIEMANLDWEIHDVNCSDFTLLDDNSYHKDTKIIIPVNLLGRSAKDVYPKYPDATIICDNAGALGSDVPNGKVGCYSLQGNKIISCGQGGFCATDDDDYATVIRQLKDFGREDKEENNTIGFNFKFNDILAAVALGQLERIDERAEHLVHQYKKYKRHLKCHGMFIDYKLGQVPLWIEFQCEDRDRLFKALSNWGIYCRKPWEPIVGLENSKLYSENTLWLPNGPNVNDGDINYVIRCIKEFYDENK